MRPASSWVFILFLVVFLSASAFAQPQAPDAPPLPSDGAGRAAAGNPPPMTDIHDIKPPELFGFDSRLVYYILFVVLGILVGVLLVAAVRYWKKRHRKDVEAVHGMLLPDEEAFRRLDALKGLEDGDGKEFYFRLSAIFRGYLQGRYGIDAPEMTTEELLPRVQALRLDNDMKTGVKDFLYTSDPIKFAGKPVDRAKMQGDFEFVRDFIVQSTPAAVEAGEK